MDKSSVVQKFHISVPWCIRHADSGDI